MMSRNTGAAHFAVSHRGDLAYVPGGVEGGNRTLVWVDRSGKTETVPLDPASYLYPRLAPDGQTHGCRDRRAESRFLLLRFCAHGSEQGHHRRHEPQSRSGRPTASGSPSDPGWRGGMTMWWMNADRSGTPERLDPKGTRQNPVSFSPDGKFIAFDQKDAETERRRVDHAGRGRRRGASDRAIEVRRRVGQVLSRREMDCVLLDRIWQAGDLRPAVPRARSEDSDLERGRHRPRLAPHGRRALLPAGQQDDGGFGR